MYCHFCFNTNEKGSETTPHAANKNELELEDKAHCRRYKNGIVFV